MNDKPVNDVRKHVFLMFKNFTTYFQRLTKLQFYPHGPSFEGPRLKYSPSRCPSEILTEIKISMFSFDQCLDLFDGHFPSLSTVIVDVDDIMSLWRTAPKTVRAIDSNRNQWFDGKLRFVPGRTAQHEAILLVFDWSHISVWWTDCSSIAADDQSRRAGTLPFDQIHFKLRRWGLPTQRYSSLYASIEDVPFRHWDHSIHSRERSRCVVERGCSAYFPLGRSRVCLCTREGVSEIRWKSCSRLGTFAYVAQSLSRLFAARTHSAASTIYRTHSKGAISRRLNNWLCQTIIRSNMNSFGSSPEVFLG